MSSALPAARPCLMLPQRWALAALQCTTTFRGAKVDTPREDPMWPTCYNGCRVKRALVGPWTCVLTAQTTCCRLQACFRQTSPVQLPCFPNANPAA